jgi:hypothetical protein
MSASDVFENDILLLIFNNVAISLIGDAPGLQGSAVAGVLYISLHTANPGEAGNQSTNETSYANYIRVPVARTVGGFTVVGSTVSNAAAVNFAACGVTGATITHFGIGTSPSGAGKLLESGALGEALVVTTLVQPQFAAGQLTSTAE